MKIKHRTDLPKKADFGRFKRGKIYGIFAEPAAGKTKMMKTDLVEYCKENKLKLLILTHRDSLKLQTLADLEEEMEELEKQFKGDGIVVINYQAIEYAFKEKQFDRILPFFTADFIVCDEAHYMVKDHWNEQTDYTVEFLEKAEGVKILMTGTPKEIRVLIQMWEVERLINPNRFNNNLKQILIFDKVTDAIDHVNEFSNSKNKSLSFVSGATSNVKRYAEANNGSFLCSKHNDLYEESDKNLMDIIIRGVKRAEKGILPTNKIFSTSVLNEGVNIIDSDLKAVYSFQPRSSTEFIQQFARPRRSDIVGCIVAPTGNMIAKQIEKAEEQLDEIYAKRVEGGNEKLGRMSEIYCHEHIREMNEIKETGFGSYVAGIYRNIQVINYGQILRDRKIADYLQTWNDQKLFIEEQEQFKQMMFEEFGYRDKNRKKIFGPKAFNQWLKDAGISYELDNSKKERSKKSEHCGKIYWTIKKRTQNDAFSIYSDSVKSSTLSAEITVEETIGCLEADKPKHIKLMSAILFKSNYNGMELTDGMKSALAEIIKTDARTGQLFGIYDRHGLSSAEENVLGMIYDEAKQAISGSLENNLFIDHEIETTKKYFYYVASDEDDEYEVS